MAAYQRYRAALRNSPGQAYLAARGIGLDLARLYHVGFAGPGRWMGRRRQFERVVFAECNPEGEVVNLYARIIGTAPKEIAHDHLPGMKGYFNAEAIRWGDGPLFITEGVFDALSLIAAGCWRTIAIIGVNGVRWSWLEKVPVLVFAFDADATGQTRAHELVRAAILRGKRARVLPPAVYGGLKDASEAWQAGVLDIEGWES